MYTRGLSECIYFVQLTPLNALRAQIPTDSGHTRMFMVKTEGVHLVRPNDEGLNDCRSASAPGVGFL